MTWPKTPAAPTVSTEPNIPSLLYAVVSGTIDSSAEMSLRAPSPGWPGPSPRSYGPAGHFVEPPAWLACLLLLLLIIVIPRVQRLACELASLDVEQLDLEQIVAVVVRGDQREALLDQLALVDREVGKLGGDDPPRGDQRASPHERHRRDRAERAAPRADRLVAQIELPVGVSRGCLGGEVDLRGELGRLALLAAGNEAHVAEQLVSA